MADKEEKKIPQKFGRDLNIDTHVIKNRPDLDIEKGELQLKIIEMEKELEQKEAKIKKTHAGSKLKKVFKNTATTIANGAHTITATIGDIVTSRPIIDIAYFAGGPFTLGFHGALSPETHKKYWEYDDDEDKYKKTVGDSLVMMGVTYVIGSIVTGAGYGLYLHSQHHDQSIHEINLRNHTVSTKLNEIPCLASMPNSDIRGIVICEPVSIGELEYKSDLYQGVTGTTIPVVASRVLHVEEKIVLNEKGQKITALYQQWLIHQQRESEYAGNPSFEINKDASLDQGGICIRESVAGGVKTTCVANGHLTGWEKFYEIPAEPAPEPTAE